MPGKGKITRKEIIEDKVLNIGKDYAKSLQPAVEANQKWLDSFAPIKAAALEYAQLEKQFKISKGRKEFLEIKQKEEVLRKKAADALKAEQNALVVIERVKQSLINTEKKQISLTNQKIKTQKQSIKLTEKEKFEQRLLNRGRREAAVLSSKLAGAYEKQAIILTRLRRKYKDVALVEGEASINAQRLQKKITKLDATLKRVDANVGQFQRNVGNYSKAMASATNAARSMASAMGLVGGSFLVVQVVRDAIGVIRDFEKQNATLSAILQVERKEMQGLTDDVVRLGATTVKTAGEVTSLQIAYARLGFEQQEILDLTEATINGSIAMNAELDQTANLTGAVINTFDDLSTTDAPKVLDVMSLATAKSALNFQKLETGIPIVAGAANAAGIPFTRLVALLGKLSDSGIDVSTSSTALRNIFIESAAQGLSYSEIIQKIKDSQDKLTAANDEFGKRAAISATVLAQNIDKTDELDTSLQNAAGTADSMAKKELDTLDGSIKLLRSAWEGYILKLDESSEASISLKGIISTLANNLDKIIDTVALGTKIYLAYKLAVLLARVQTSLMNKQFLLSRKVSLASAKGVTVATLSWKKFNAVLKANALGIAVAALTGLVYLFNKYNKSLSESIESTNDATKSYLETRDAQEKTARSLKNAAVRYEELSKKTDLNKSEQIELDEIIKKLAKDVPIAVTEIDKYGNALKINAGLVKKFTDESSNIIGRQREVTLLKENEEQLRRLQDLQKSYNNIKKEEKGFYIDGIGKIANYNGQLRKQEIVEGRLSRTTKAGALLSAKELDIVQKTIRENEVQIEQKNKFIETLSEEGRARIKEREEKEKLTIANKKLSDESKILANNKIEEALKVSDLKEKIKSLKKEQEDLTENDKDRAKDISKLIEVYQKKIDTILGTSKANKSAEKAERERLELEKKLKNDALKLGVFSLKQNIKEQEGIAKNTKESLEVRSEAIQKQSKLEIELAMLTAKGKFDSTKEFTDKEIEALLTKSKVSKDTQKKVGDEELLIIAEFQAKKNEIQNRRSEGQEGLELDKIKKESELKIAEKEKELNDELRLENEIFNKREGIYSNIENATEVREKRIAEIKKKYALEALNAQISAVEKLLDNEELSVEKKAEYEAKLAKIKLEASDLTTENTIKNDDKEVLSAKEKFEVILDVSNQLTAALDDLASSIFESRIQKIDEELAKNDEKYERLLENESLSEEERKTIEKQRENDREALESKKKKEQMKQARVNKIAALTQAGINTALAVTAALSTVPFLPLGPTMAILAGSLGAIQIAAIAAKPIPKYAKGTDYHIGGRALVGEERAEVISEPNKNPYIVDRPTILDLPTGTKVTPSLEEYDRLMRASVLTSIDIEKQKLNDFEARQAFDINNKEMIQEMRLTRKAFEKNKPKVVVQQSKQVDFAHELFRLKNSDWSA